MYCQNCGAELTENAKFCPECGERLSSALADQSVGSLRIARENSSVFQRDKTLVYLDGTLIYKIENNRAKLFSVPVGNHVLELRTRAAKKKMYISIAPNQESAVFFKLSATSSNAHKITSINDPSGSSSHEERSEVKKGPPQRRCPHCGGVMTIQAVSESRKAGCGTFLLYVILFLSILGWLVLIPLMLRRKTVSKTYAICQNCGYQRLLSTR